MLSDSSAGFSNRDMHMGSLDTFRLDGRVALVTGAARGLGLAMSGALAEAGARVVMSDIDGNGLAASAAGLQSKGHQVVPIRADVSRAEDVEQMVQEAASACKRIDVLVNNAGINAGGSLPPEDLDLATFEKVQSVNLTGSFLCAQAVGRQMIRQGGGKIINIASVLGLVVSKLTDRHPLAYCVSKAGVIMMTKVLAAEWAKHHIYVNAIAPSYFDTDILNPDPKIRAEMLDALPMHRLGKPAELGGTVVYLASDASAMVTGHVLLVDGGYTAW